MRNPLNRISGTCLFHGGRFVLGNGGSHTSNPRAEVSHTQASNFLQMWFRGSGDTKCPLVLILPMVALAPSVVVMLLQNWHAVLFSQHSSKNALHLACSSCVYHLVLCAAAELDDPPLVFFLPKSTDTTIPIHCHVVVILLQNWNDAPLVFFLPKSTDTLILLFTFMLLLFLCLFTVMLLFFSCRIGTMRRWCSFCPRAQTQPSRSCA
jgi:hypothetical protein